MKQDEKKLNTYRLALKDFFLMDGFSNMTLERGMWGQSMSAVVGNPFVR